MSKLPYLMIYVGDFYSHLISTLSPEAQCLWFRLKLQMHLSERRGYLQLNNLPMPSELASSRAGFTIEQYESILKLLIVTQTFHVTQEGIIFDKEIAEQEEQMAMTNKRVKKFRRRKNETNLKRMCNANETPIEDVYVNENVDEGVDVNETLKSFNSFWEKFPKKKAKKTAWAAWKRLSPNKEMLDKIIDGLNNQIKSSEWIKNDGQFIPHASTWINGKRWEDEIVNYRETHEKKDEEPWKPGEVRFNEHGGVRASPEKLQQYRDLMERSRTDK